MLVREGVDGGQRLLRQPSFSRGPPNSIHRTPSLAKRHVKGCIQIHLVESSMSSPSFWDRYLAPGDLRSQQTPVQPPALFSSATAPTEEVRPPQPPPEPRIDAAHRLRRQNALFYGGLAFTTASLWITRRSLRRKQALYAPKTFSPSTDTPAGFTATASKEKISTADGGLEAVEALGLATLNVFTIAMTAIGAGMKYWDIADVEDMRDKVRAGIGFDVYGGDSEADKEMEAWVVDVLSKKDGVGGMKESIAEKLQELSELDRRKAEEEALKKQ